MAFMIPQYENTKKWSLEMPNGESELFSELGDALANIRTDADIGNGESYTITCEHGWFARLSAPGYMDCTDWAGPFDSLDEARLHIIEMFEVDPDTGESSLDDTRSADHIDGYDRDDLGESPDY